MKIMSYVSAGKPEKLEDAVYEVGGKRHLLIQQGALHLPTCMLPRGAKLNRDQVVHVVMSQTGWQMTFARAAGIVAAYPHLAPAVQKMAARLGCSL